MSGHGKGKVTKVEPAGPEHQVSTVTIEGSHLYRREPCSDCPWRVDAVGVFPAEAFRVSAHTSYDMDKGLFACHQSGSFKPATCAGFLLKGSTHNLTVRLQSAKGSLNLSEVHDGGHELHEGYREMAVANGVQPDDPVLRRCRS